MQCFDSKVVLLIVESNVYSRETQNIWERNAREERAVAHSNCAMIERPMSSQRAGHGLGHHKIIIEM